MRKVSLLGLGGALMFAIIAARPILGQGTQSSTPPAVTSAAPQQDVQAPLPSSAPPPPIHVTGIEAATHLVHAVRPVYPEIAVVARIQGTVVFHVVVATSGSVKKLQYIAGPPILMRAGANAVTQWKYRPFLDNGAPVEAMTTVVVPFGSGTMACDSLAEHSELARKLQALVSGNDDVIDASLDFGDIHDFEAVLMAARDLGIPFAQLKCAELGGVFCSPPTIAKAMSLSKAIQALKPEMSKDEVKAAEKKAKEEAKSLS